MPRRRRPRPWSIGRAPAGSAPSGPGRSGRGGAYGGEAPRESVDRGSVLGGETATPLAVIADGHQRVRDPRAEHEVPGVAHERDRVRLAGHRDRWAAALDQDGLEALPDGRWLRGDDDDPVDGGFHTAEHTRTYVRLPHVVGIGVGRTLRVREHRLEPKGARPF